MLKIQKLAKDFAKNAKPEKKEKPSKPAKQQTPVAEDAALSVKPGKDKGKDKARDKKKGGKKGRGTSIGGSSRFSSEENLSAEGSKTDIDGPTTLGKGGKEKVKRKKSKGCEEAVSKAVTDLWESAWNICADRFFVTSAPTTVSLELRNTWLRIVEAEWQDPDMRERVTTRPNRIFLRDEPPLPLAFDTWSRGAMELLPRYRRESVLDPFLRDLDYFNQPDEYAKEESSESQEEKNLSTMDEPQSTDVPTTAPENKVDQEKKSLTASEPKSARPDSQPPSDNWDFELDKKVAANSSMKKLMVQQEQQRLSLSLTEGQQEESTSSPLNDSASVSLSIDQKSESEDSPNSILNEKVITTILPSRTISDDSKTDVEYSSTSKGGTGKVRRSQERRFSPSQCGGRDGSGVFRLPHETTSEALLKMQLKDGSDKRIIGHHVTSLVEMETDKRQSLHPSKRTNLRLNESMISNDLSADLTVQPLFEERTPRAAHEDGGRFSFELSARMKASFAPDLHLDSITSEKEKQFLKRKVANLQNRYRRQTMKFLATKAIITNTHAVLGGGVRVSTGAGAGRASAAHHFVTGALSNSPPFNDTSKTSLDSRNEKIESQKKVAKTATSEPSLSKMKQQHANVRPVQLRRKMKKVVHNQGQKHSLMMKERPSLGKMEPSIELYGRKREVDQALQKPCDSVVQLSDTCLYTRRKLGKDNDDECYPKNDFELQQELRGDCRNPCK